MTRSSETRWFATERKYIVSEADAAGIAAWSRRRMQPDPYARGETGDGYRISTLYFDSPEFALFNRQGSHGRAKYRIRRYGTSETVFLERKLKKDVMLAKRRCSVPLDEVIALYSHAQTDSPWIGRWFRRRLKARRFVPVCRVSTHRMARVLPSGDGMVRLTMDHNLCASVASEIDFAEVLEPVRLLEGQIILEMKYQGEMPAVLCEAVKEFGLEAAAVSKYRLAMRTLGLVPETATLRP